MRPLKVGFVGSGFVANFHARAMRSVREMELWGILERGGARRLADFAEENHLGPAKIFRTIAEMAREVDAIALYCPNDQRMAAMEEIAQAKRRDAPFFGVICEKPLGRNLAEAKRMVELANEAGLLTAYFENQIHMPSLRMLLEQLTPQQRSMGPLTLTRTAEEHSGPHSPWFWDPTRQGGGVLSDMGCHSIAVGWYVLTPKGKGPTFLTPESVSCTLECLKWGRPQFRDQLLQRFGIDFSKSPAEDFATGVVTYRNPSSGQRVVSQFTDSWMFDKQGLRLFIEAMGPGYGLEVNTLLSSSSLFVGDEAVAEIMDAECALEKSTSSRGQCILQPNEPDLYGYIEENRDAVASFLRGKNALLSFDYGFEVVKLVMAAYLSAERGQAIDLTTPNLSQELLGFVPLIQQGKGGDLLSPRRTHFESVS